VILVTVVVVDVDVAVAGPLAAFALASFCSGSFKRFCPAAAPRLEIDIAVDNDPLSLLAMNLVECHAVLALDFW